MRRITILYLLFSFQLSAQYQVLSTADMNDYGCTGTIEIITDGEFSPYSIEFDNGLIAVIPEGELSYTFQNICAGNYGLVVTNGISCEKRIENIVINNTGLNAPCETEVNIKVLLEGPYNQSTGLMSTAINNFKLLPGQKSKAYVSTVNELTYSGAPWNYEGVFSSGISAAVYTSDIVDWLLISYRTTELNTSTFLIEPALLRHDGVVVFPSGCSRLNELGSLPETFYVVVEHKSHLAIMSPQEVPDDDISIDFSLANSYKLTVSYGQKELPNGQWVMYAGDINQTASRSDINGSDKVTWTVVNGQFGLYNSADVNCDADVNGADKGLWSANNGITSIITQN